MLRLLVLLILVGGPAFAQTIPVFPKTGRNPDGTPASSPTDVQNTLGTKADSTRLDAEIARALAAEANIQIATPLGTRTVVDLLNGTQPITLNPSPSAAASPCTGNAAQVSVRNSNITHPTVMAGLFGSAGHACDGLQAVLNVTSGATATQTNAVSGYIWNTNPTLSGGAFANGVGVGLNTGAINAVDGAQSWGIAGIIGDVGTGGSIGRTMYNELDFHPKFANTQVVGFILAMDSAVQPRNADGWVVGTTIGSVPGATAKWVNGFRCYDGSVAGTCMLIGLGASTVSGVPASTSSQVLGFQFSDSSSVGHIATVTATPTGLLVGRSDSVNYDLMVSGYVASGLGMQVGGVTVLRNRQGGWGVPTGTLSRASFNTATVTTAQLAQVVAALLADVTYHGAIGP